MLISKAMVEGMVVGSSSSLGGGGPSIKYDKIQTSSSLFMEENMMR